MNRLPSDKARHLYRLFAYGHGQRESALLAGVNRDTAARHYRLWLSVRPRLQRAFDALWEHDCDTCDAILAEIPDDLSCSMLDCWMDDQDETQTIKSGWYAGYEDAPQATEASAGEDEAAQPGQVQGQSQETWWPHWRVVR